MSWVFFVLFGATINAFVNYGYKYFGSRVDHSFLIATVMAIAGMIMGIYGVSFEFSSIGHITWLHVLCLLGMGIGTAFVWMLLVHVLSRGMISLADPLWACVYALVSILIGMGLAAENPKIISLMGVGLYIVGAFLIAIGAQQKKEVGKE